MNIAPENWSAMQGVKFCTLSNIAVNNDVTSGSIVSATDSITQGNFFCNLATGPNIAACAAVPAFLAIAVFWVAANVTLKTLLYNVFNPPFNLSPNVFALLTVKSPVNEFAMPVSFFALLAINFNFCCPVAPFTSFTAFCTSVCISVAASVPARETHFPITVEVCRYVLSVVSFNWSILSLSKLTVGVCSWLSSPVSFLTMVLSPGVVSGVYPVKGTNGEEYFAPDFAAYLELPITPKITGIWASSPSKKKPTTISLGLIRNPFLYPFLPDPLFVGTNIIAYGKSLSASSVVFCGW